MADEEDEVLGGSWLGWLALLIPVSEPVPIVSSW